MRVRAAVISCSLAGALAVQSATTAARAQATDQDKALASTLFDEAKVLLAGGQVGAACRKLEESRRLNPLPGTLSTSPCATRRRGFWRALTPSSVKRARWPSGTNGQIA